MIKFIKSLFAPVVKIETPVVEEVKAVEAPAKKAPAAKKPAVKKVTTRRPRAVK